MRKRPVLSAPDLIANADLFASRGDHIEFARFGLGGDRECQFEQAIRLAGHRGGHDHHLVTCPMPFGNAPRNIPNALNRTHRSAAVIMNNQRHAGDGKELKNTQSAQWHRYILSSVESTGVNKGIVSSGKSLIMIDLLTGLLASEISDSESWIIFKEIGCSL